MYKITYILIVIILAVFIYTGIYGCGCGSGTNNEKFENKVYRFDTPAVKDIKKVIDASILT
jgi:hypothetical protein